MLAIHKSKLKRFMVALLAVVMMIGLMPAQLAFAGDATGTGGVILPVVS